ncbi:Harbinger transposase-derived nuclease domain [Sesbania bispinosa]|nr:Harbinger transposase-derived nuclease domain [Sesbania bispinosa]
MESRKLAALLSTLVSQLLLLILLIFPPDSTDSTSNSTDSIFPLIHHFLFSQQTAVTTILSRKRKRKRPDSRSDNDDPNPPNRSPDWFRNSFMMTSSTFEWLSGLLEPLLDCRDPAELFPLNLSAGVRLGIGLFRLANGSDYPEISERFGVSVSVAKFCVKQLCRVLCTNFRFWVSFPNNPNDLRSVSQGFEALSGLPNCCGVVFCSRFEVVATTNTTPVAAQIVVDSTCRVLSIAAGFLGHKSDSEILKASTLFKDIEEGVLMNAASPVNELNQYLIGDSGYPLLPWLMVPFVDTLPGSVEENFNDAHRLMRLAALRTDASLRNWGVLKRPVQEELRMAVAYIGACSILHNSLLMREDFSALAGGFEDHRQSHDSHRPCAVEEDPVMAKALVVRTTLATMAKKNS